MFNKRQQAKMRGLQVGIVNILLQLLVGVQAEYIQQPLQCFLDETVQTGIVAGVECVMNGDVREDDIITYTFLASDEYDLMFTLHAMEGDTDLTIAWPGLSKDGDPYVSERFGEGDSVDQIFVSRFKMSQHPGLWTVNISSYLPLSSYQLEISTIDKLRLLHEDDLDVLLAINEQCCQLSFSCPQLTSFLRASARSNPEEDFCHQPPNQCDEEGHITSLIIEGDVLDCAVPMEIAQLKNLIHLELQDLGLSGTTSDLAMIIQNLPNLQTLNLASNRISGNLTCDLANDELRLFMLSDNLLEGTLPECILAIKELRELILGKNFLTGTLPPLPKDSQVSFIAVNEQFGEEKMSGVLPAIEEAEELLLLWVYNNQFEGPLPILQNPFVREIHCGGNQFTGEIPEEYASYKELRYLNLTSNKLSGLIPEGVAQLTRVRALDLSSNKFNGPIPDVWDVDSWSIQLQNNQLSGPIPGDLALVPGLLLLGLSGNQLTGTLDEFGDALLNTTAKIYDFEVNNNQLTGTLPSQLSLMSAFSEKYLRGPTPQPNKFFIKNNNFSGQMPDFIISGVLQYDNLLVDVSGNQLSCPEDLPEGVELKNSLGSLRCLVDGEEVPLLLHVRRNLYSQFECFDSATNADINAYDSEGKLEFVPELICRAEDVIVGENVQSFLYYVSPASDAEYDLWFTLNTLTGDADIRVYWLEGSPVDYEIHTSSRSGQGAQADVVTIPRTKLSEAPGWWQINITSFAPESTYELEVEAVGKLRLLNDFDKKVLKAVYRDCCDDACFSYFRSALSTSRMRSLEDDLCYRPPNKCNSEGHLLHLNLDDVGLRCPFPELLSQLSNLTTLELRRNAISGDIGKFAETIPDNIRYLSLTSNQIKGQLPCSIAKDRLRSIALADNQISGSVPACLFEAPQLVDLFLDKNNLNGTLPDPSTAKKLVILNLSEQEEPGLTGPIPDLDSLSKLHVLELSKNSFTGPLPMLPKDVLVVRMDGNQLTGQIPMEYGLLPRLEDLSLNKNQLTGEINIGFYTLPAITILDIAYNNFTGVLADVWDTPELRLLYLQGNQLSGTLPASLADEPKLRALGLADNQLTGTLGVFAEALPKDSPLAYFDVANNKLEGSIPTAISKMSAFGNDYQRTAYGAPLPNVFDLQDNNFTGDIPDFLYQAVDDLFLYASVSGNQFNCPDTLPVGVNLTLSSRFSDITCTDIHGYELPVPLYGIIAKLLPTNLLEDSEELVCVNEAQDSGVLIPDEDTICRQRGSVVADQQHSYWFYVRPNPNYSLEVALTSIVGDADLYVDWLGRAEDEDPLQSFGWGDTPDEIIISQRNLIDHPGIWFVNVTALIDDSEYQLSVTGVPGNDTETPANAALRPDSSLI
eukprot:TRINITY_DN2797_c0_g3_i1.p1 TRINITY_DN2797_c0_g3~~TRINITY_DN2797_c0_g3_i1.p1  ORF type:complete len:1370 (-),score=193.24 TRINITY_DN2797_c0_g3_i1:641-4750(-)